MVATTLPEGGFEADCLRGGCTPSPPPRGLEGALDGALAWPGRLASRAGALASHPHRLVCGLLGLQRDGYGPMRCSALGWAGGAMREGMGSTSVLASRSTECVVVFASQTMIVVLMELGSRHAVALLSTPPVFLSVEGLKFCMMVRA